MRERCSAMRPEKAERTVLYTRLFGGRDFFWYFSEGLAMVLIKCSTDKCNHNLSADAPRSSMHSKKRLSIKCVSN